MNRSLRILLLVVMTSGVMTLSAAQKTVRQEPEDAVVSVVAHAQPVRARSLRPKTRRITSSFRPQLQEGVIPSPASFGSAVKSAMKKAGSVQLDLRLLPQTPALPKLERPERKAPPVTPTQLPADATTSPFLPSIPTSSAPSPATTANFDGLDYANWGDGHPPDTNGDVGPTYYIQTINTAVGVYRKTDGVRVAGFSFDTLMSQGHFGNLCDTNNYGDPVVVYDTFEDRWILTDFAFQLDGSGNVVNPPGSFQCFAVSMTGDPVNGGWNFYSINTTGGLGDYPKFGIWPDGLYMMANMFDYPATGNFQNTRMYAFNKAQMYAGKPSVQIVSFDAPAAEFTILPANARLQAGTPPAGSPNYCAVVWNLTNAVSIYKFHVDWNRPSLSSFTGAFGSVAPNSWADAPALVPSLGGNSLDSLADETMVQNQYTNQSGVESVWLTHTVLGAAAAIAAPRYYQVDVTGGTVAANTVQAFTHAPDNTLSRFMPSLAVDRAGDMAIGYSTSSSSTNPAIKYAGRLAGDPLNTLPQTEATLINGTGTQVGNCGTTCERWGDYSAMSLDPDGCRFWYTNMYYATSGLNFLTRIGAFAFPTCTPVGSGGTLQGTVTAAAGGAPLSGVSIAFGARSTTTNASGLYSFTGIPAGTYPAVIASKPGIVPQSASPVVVTDSGTTTKDFSLAAAAASACLTDTTQADFQTGVATQADLDASPGSVTLANTSITDQRFIGIVTNVAFNATNWFGQTFTAGVSGLLTSVDVALDCSACSGTTPNITVGIRAVSGTPPNASIPAGPDLATATIPGFSTTSPIYFSAAFATPLSLVAGTQYAIVVRPVSNPSAGTYQYLVGAASDTTYGNGRRVSSADSGATWPGPNTRDMGFQTHMKFNQGNFVSAVKDSNPAGGLTPIWSTLSWTGSTPSGTSIQFQVAGSNSDSGPFTFIGPDGTGSTFFTTSGASLSAIYGMQYLQYKAYLSTANPSLPTLSDVTVCYDVVSCSLPTPTISGGPATSCAGSTVTLTSSSATSNQWLLNGVAIQGATASTYAATTSGSYTVQVTGAGGCRATSAAKQLTFGTVITVDPSTISDGTVGVAYSAAFTSSGGTGSVSLAETGALPSGLQFSGGGLTGTPSTAGTFTITITGTDANGCSGSRNYTFTIASVAGTAPVNLRATANSTAQITLTWTPVATATSYDVLRQAPGGSPILIGSPASNGFVDVQSLQPLSTYVYWVRAAGPGFPVNLSLPDLATTIIFTDDPLIAGSTVIKAIQLTEVRNAVNAVRTAAGLSSVTFTDPSSAGVFVKTLHILELRAALDPARAQIGVPAVTYADAITAGAIVRAIDLTQLRDGVK